MDALFFHKIYRAAFIILDTKAFSIFVFNDVLNDQTFEWTCVFISYSLLDCII